VADNLMTVDLPDGRVLGYAEWGDPAGTPVLMLHGTPGCRLNRTPDNAKLAATGARVVTYDRPGYGASDRHHGRTVVDCVADITALVDHLGIETFAVSGGSGGGPHCLAVAAEMPERVTRAACIVGIAPYDVLGERWFEGMDPANVREFGWALESEERVTEGTTHESAAMISRITDDPANVLGDFEIPAEDRAILSRPDVAAVMTAALKECVRNGVGGWVDDDLAFTKPWGFDPATISVPTAVWWGAKDVLTPPAHGEWIAATVPHAVVRIDHGAGHMADPDDNLRRLLPWLVDGTPWKD
jgi:pimeloyl-ACP methyl ester carboxylesterase